MKRKWLKYIGLIVGITFFIFAGSSLLYEFKTGVEEFRKNTFSTPAMWVWYVDAALYTSFGFLLGGEYLMKENDKIGKWRVNLTGLFIMGIPCLIFVSIVPAFFSLQISLPYTLFFVTGAEFYSPLFKVLLGYIIARSFYKKKRDLVIRR